MGGSAAILRLLVPLQFLDGGATAVIIVLCFNLSPSNAFLGLALVGLSLFVGAISVLLWYEVEGLERNLDAYDCRLREESASEDGEGYAND